VSTENETPKPFVVKMGEGEKTITSGMGNLLVRRMATAGQTGGEFGLLEFSGAQGTGVFPHSHGAEAEAFYIVEGTFRVWAGDIDHLAQAGDFVYIPKNARHKFRIESAFGRLLCLITPGTGFEEFFVEVGQRTDGVFPPNPADFPTPARPENFPELAERFHLQLEEDW
jgi:quercetin dioxygenase-like cupin family protein